MRFSEAPSHSTAFSWSRRECSPHRWPFCCPPLGHPRPPHFSQPAGRRGCQAARAPCTQVLREGKLQTQVCLCLQADTAEGPQRSVLKGLGNFSDAQAGSDWSPRALPGSGNPLPCSVCQGCRTQVVPTQGTLARPEIPKTAALCLGCHGNHLEILKLF